MLVDTEAVDMVEAAVVMAVEAEVAEALHTLPFKFIPLEVVDMAAVVMEEEVVDMAAVAMEEEAVEEDMVVEAVVAEALHMPMFNSVPLEGTP